MSRWMTRAELNEDLVRMLDSSIENAMVEYIKFDDEEPHVFNAFFYRDIELIDVRKFRWDQSEEDYKQSLRNLD